MVVQQSRKTGGENEQGCDDDTHRQYPYQTLQIRSAEKTLVMDLWIVYVPLDRGAAHQSHLRHAVRFAKPGVPCALDLAWPLLVWFTERIFKEDREIVGDGTGAPMIKQGARLEPRGVSRLSTICATCCANAAAGR